MNVTGTVEKILDVESGKSKSDKEWSKQSIVINNGDNYNPLVCISFFGDKADEIQKVKVGDNVSVGINLSSREYEGRYFHNIDGWCINKVDAKVDNAPAEDDDLPF